MQLTERLAAGRPPPHLSPLTPRTAERKAVAYSFRPYLPPGCGAAAVGCGAAGAGGPLPLGGFGVSMALKNMEYKAIDDSKVAPADASAADGSGGETDFGTEDVHGFLFKRLVERKPELKAELSMCAAPPPLNLLRLLRRAQLLPPSSFCGLHHHTMYFVCMYAGSATLSCPRIWRRGTSWPSGK